MSQCERCFDLISAERWIVARYLKCFVQMIPCCGKLFQIQRPDCKRPTLPCNTSRYRWKDKLNVSCCHWPRHHSWGPGSKFTFQHPCIDVYKTAWVTSNYCVCFFFGRICILSTFISWNSSSTWVYLYSSLDRIMWSARDWANPTSYAWEPGGFTEILCCRIKCFSH